LSTPQQSKEQRDSLSDWTIHHGSASISALLHSAAQSSSNKATELQSSVSPEQEEEEEEEEEEEDPPVETASESFQPVPETQCATVEPDYI